MNRQATGLNQLAHSLAFRLTVSTGWVRAPRNLPRLDWTGLTDEIGDHLEDRR